MKKLAAILFIALLANTAYIAAFASPTIFYMGNVLLHLTLGAVVFFLAFRFLPRPVQLFAAITFLTGAWLTYSGAITENQTILYAHIGVGAVASLWALYSYRQSLGKYAAIPLLALLFSPLAPKPNQRILNPTVVPTSMEQEGGGPSSPFWPSSSKTNVGGTIPSDFFMDSKLCGECHKDAYQQWNSSAHHFASFNNQYYRKSIEQMQEISGTKGSKWCASCHDHAVFFNGRFDKPIKDQIDTPEAQNGLGCLSCHSIINVDGTTGNGGFTIEYPPLHELASSRNRYIRAFDNFLTYLDPEPHRRIFMKPFMKKDSSEYCSTCHKVHLDVPVNNYRWARGFNDYDNWQASGVSGQGARSFYYPPKTSTCTDCHMPLVESKDPGSRDGKMHNHRFPGANMAVAHVNKDKEQLEITEKFLKSGFISVDIFAASPVTADSSMQMVRRSGVTPALNSLNAVGEESEAGGPAMLREVGEISAPIDKAGATFQPGQTVRLDVVVRTRKIGHFFPGGTLDSFDIWLELEGKDQTGQTVFWSGALEEDGAVETGAHFYRALLLDGEGNPINKRNAWQARSAFYVRAIPPGAADTIHYRVKIPPTAQGAINFTAKLNYRKFSHFYNKYAFAGKAGAGEAALHHDSREYSFDKTNIPKNVSGQIKGEIPVLPIVVLAEAKATLPLSGPTQWKPVAAKADRERWNDWGIGLLLQGDLKGAEYAFKKVTEAEPGYADGWLNVARALIQEGETEAAKPYLEKALSLDSSLARIHFFKALVQKADGDYDAALASLATVVSKYPRDRVAQNQIGRILFLQRKYAESVVALKNVISIDIEDVQAHYTLMLAYRGLGDAANADREETLFRRFKADESAQAITHKHRHQSAEDNNERQMIHEHESISLPRQPQRSPSRPVVAGKIPGLDQSRRPQLRAQQRPGRQAVAPGNNGVRGGLD